MWIVLNLKSMNARGAIYFHLKATMDKHKVRPSDLADLLGVNRNTVSDWRNSRYLPATNELRVIQILKAINDLSELGVEAVLSDLIEIDNDALRSQEVFEYGYISSKRRIKEVPPPEAYEYPDKPPKPRKPKNT
jgi:transcriptional regulator with XRE-family HTH domain